MQSIFTSAYTRHIKREGADKLLEWLNESDFFTSPVSPSKRLPAEAGLVTHSVHVYRRLRSMYIQERTDPRFPGMDYQITPEEEETIAICGLLHDICKANHFVKKEDETTGEVTYVVHDEFPYGHGEKSAFIAASFMKLTPEEALSLRWHYGQHRCPTQDLDAIAATYEKYPMAVLLHAADYLACYFDEHYKNNGIWQ